MGKTKQSLIFKRSFLRKLFPLFCALVLLTVYSVSRVQTGMATDTLTTAAETASENILAVHFLDVGQGDAIFVQLPDGQTMLIDSGDDDGGAILDYIKSLKCDEITYAVATHPHLDHIGGMADVLNGISVGKFYMPKISSSTRAFERMLTALKEEGCGIITAKAGVTILDTAVLKITIIAPVKNHYKDVNNYSAVIKLTYKNNTFLFTGDAGALSESQIISDIDADVLKVGHHGSSDSSSDDFLLKVSPEYAVISCGKGNSYGHPHAETMQKLKKSGAKIYRTDLSGTIVMTSNGKTINVNRKPESGQPGTPD